MVEKDTIMNRYFIRGIGQYGDDIKWLEVELMSTGPQDLNELCDLMLSGQPVHIVPAWESEPPT